MSHVRVRLHSIPPSVRGRTSKPGRSKPEPAALDFLSHKPIRGRFSAIPDSGTLRSVLEKKLELLTEVEGFLDEGLMLGLASFADGLRKEISVIRGKLGGSEL